MKPQRIDVVERVTADVLAALERGTIPWRQKWTPCGATMHRNAVSNRHYRGMNRITLPGVATARGYRAPLWLTYRQAESLGGNVNRGERSALVMYWHISDTVRKAPDGSMTRKRSVWAKGSAVFNIAQCTFPAPILERFERMLEPRPNAATPEGPAAALLATLDGWTAAQGITRAEGSPSYSPSADVLRMPPASSWNGAHACEHMAHTLAHECAHATGHPSRLDRSMAGKFGSKDYAREELIAELAASFLASAHGMDVPDVDNNRDAYIASWLRALRDDPRAVIVAAGAADRAFASIMGTTPAATETETETDAPPAETLEPAASAEPETPEPAGDEGGLFA